jgi:hypothetical protein
MCRKREREGVSLLTFELEKREGRGGAIIYIYIF